jgi:hypothetical protein
VRGFERGRPSPPNPLSQNRERGSESVARTVAARVNARNLKNTVVLTFSRIRARRCSVHIALGFALTLTISSCVPALTVQDLEPSLSLSTQNEVAWAINGDGFVALPPGYAPQKLASPSIVAGVAWRDGAPWMALPGAGLVQRGLGVPESVSLPGRPVRVSSKYIFTNASTVHSYSGTQVAQLPGRVRDVLETKDRTYVLLEAQDQSLVYALDENGATLIDRIYPGIPFNPSRFNMLPTDLSYEFLPRPAARANGVTYQARGITLEASAQGSVLGSVTLVAEPLVISANDETVAVLSRDALEVFRAPRSGSGLERLARITFGGTP